MRFACELRGEACVIKNARASSPQLIRVIYARRSLEAIRTLSSRASHARACVRDFRGRRKISTGRSLSLWPDRSNNSSTSRFPAHHRTACTSARVSSRSAGARDSRRDESIGSVNRPSSSEALCRFPRGDHLSAKASRNCTSPRAGACAASRIISSTISTHVNAVDARKSRRAAEKSMTRAF